MLISVASAVLVACQLSAIRSANVRAALVIGVVALQVVAALARERYFRRSGIRRSDGPS